MRNVPPPDVRCPECGYDLRGIPEHRCPECGFGFDRAAVRSIAGDWCAARLARFQDSVSWQCAAGLAMASCLVERGSDKDLRFLIILGAPLIFLATILAELAVTGMSDTFDVPWARPVVRCVRRAATLFLAVQLLNVGLNVDLIPIALLLPLLGWWHAVHAWLEYRSGRATLVSNEPDDPMRLELQYWSRINLACVAIPATVVFALAY